MSRILLDTNILIFSKQSTSDYHAPTVAAILNLAKAGKDLIVCPQVLREFHKVATTPTTANGFGMKPYDSLLELNNIESTYTLLSEKSDQFGKWKEILDKYLVSGKTSHDANIYAFMRSHSIEEILTHNVKDFRRYLPNIIIRKI